MSLKSRRTPGDSKPPGSCHAHRPGRKPPEFSGSLPAYPEEVMHKATPKGLGKIHRLTKLRAPGGIAPSGPEPRIETDRDVVAGVSGTEVLSGKDRNGPFTRITGWGCVSGGINRSWLKSDRREAFLRGVLRTTSHFTGDQGIAFSKGSLFGKVSLLPRRLSTGNRLARLLESIGRALLTTLHRAKSVRGAGSTPQPPTPRYTRATRKEQAGQETSGVESE